MASFYGKHWLDMWIDIPIESVKAEWQAKLQGKSSNVVFKAVDFCSDNLKFPPTLPEFVLLCKANTPSEITKALPRHFTEAEIAKNHERIEKVTSDLAASARTDHKAWARNIVANPSKYPDLSLSMAKSALAATA